MPSPGKPDQARGRIKSKAGTTAGPDVTQLLQAWGNGDRDAQNELLRIVYGELRRLARAHLRRESPLVSLQATALVNEAYLRLVDQRRVRWQNRAHFLNTAAHVMRRILVDHARRRRRAKRGGGATEVQISDVAAPRQPRHVDLLALDQALDKLAALDDRQSRLVVMRFFGGLTVDEIAEVLSLSPSTVKREWTTARLWLRRELAGEGGPSGHNEPPE